MAGSASQGGGTEERTSQIQRSEEKCGLEGSPQQLLDCHLPQPGEKALPRVLCRKLEPANVAGSCCNDISASHVL